RRGTWERCGRWRRGCVWGCRSGGLPRWSAGKPATRGAGGQIFRLLSDLRRPRSPSTAGNGGDLLEESVVAEESRVNSRVEGDLLEEGIVAPRVASKLAARPCQ